MNTQEKIEVMKAYAEGKKIQWRISGCKWEDWTSCDDPIWNWSRYEFRIKSEEKYRPYRDTGEMIEDFRRKVGMGQPSLFLPAIWIKANDGFVSFISEYGSDCIWRATCQESITMNGLFRNFTYLDGSPCGMKED